MDPLSFSTVERERGCVGFWGFLEGAMSLGMSRDQRVTDTKVEIAKRLRKNATPAEALLWEALRGRRHANLKFRRQQVIAGYIVDFYCEERSGSGAGWQHS
jgi:hypothetical protein